MGGSTAELWFWIVLLVVLVGVGGYVLEKLRRLGASSRPSCHDWLSEFREMHSRGMLSDQEFQTIKSTLIPQIHQQRHPPINKDKPNE